MNYLNFYRVFFRAVSWLRDSHGLFDYESRNIVKMSLKTQSQGQIIRNDDQIDFAKPDHVIDQEQHPNGRSLCQLKKDPGKYFNLLSLLLIFIIYLMQRVIISITPSEPKTKRKNLWTDFGQLPDLSKMSKESTTIKSKNLMPLNWEELDSELKITDATNSIFPIMNFISKN